eukprot:CAMPEP_0170566324 /NCGR_PEP_ID=MMETSP0211-20121228/79764_1 /TAXON_ID=311385 /ORGANISM="Pseudokeronopsis sp., Strain OXSARD2" /LENGTH=61 /DNA_ID=CAMNT_0010887461 /DNA_START=1590 /DNA_END=1775 /DNA_ORIENTATION=-
MTYAIGSKNGMSLQQQYDEGIPNQKLNKRRMIPKNVVEYVSRHPESNKVSSINQYEKGVLQ